jgi:MOSC domain-containing protein YiiM
MDGLANSIEGEVTALAASPTYGFSKHAQQSLDLVAGIGVAGDIHAGATVCHRSRMAANPAAPNLRQVHLLHSELLAELAAEGFAVASGQLGENVTTHGIGLLALPRGTVLAIGEEVLLELTGLRNPCSQIEEFRPGLLGRLARKRGDGSIERLSGVMAVVQRGGRICKGDRIGVIRPPLPHALLEPV